MYLALSDVYDSNFNRNDSEVYIVDFVPYIEEDSKVRVPGNELYTKKEMPSVLFADVDYDFCTYEDSKKYYNPISFKEYQEEFDRFVNREFSRGVIVKHRPVEILYEFYKIQMEHSDVSGYVDITEGSFVDRNKPFLFTPPEGCKYPIGLEAYTTTLSRILPQLVLDRVSLEIMYKMYLERYDFKKANTKELKIITMARDLEDVIAIVDEALEECDLSATQLENIVKTRDKEYLLDPYYDYMSDNYDLRDTLSFSLLVYSSVLVKKYIEKSSDKADIDPTESVPVIIEPDLDRFDFDRTEVDDLV